MTNLVRGEMNMKCGIKHGFGDQTCIRHRGHDGFCRSAAFGNGQTITYSEWISKNGRFKSHVGYQTIYPRNGWKVDGES